MANYTQMLLDLQNQRERIDHAITALGLVQGSSGKRRGRPPKWMKENQVPTAYLEKPVRKFSAEARRKMAQSQKARWAGLKTPARSA